MIKYLLDMENICEEGSLLNEMKIILMVICVFKINYLFCVVSYMR